MTCEYDQQVSDLSRNSNLNMIQMNVNLPYKINGPFFKFSSPYGKATCQRDVWYVSKQLEPHERTTPIQKILGSTSLGEIHKPYNRDFYVISQTFPILRFSTLDEAISHLLKNEYK